MEEVRRREGGLRKVKGKRVGKERMGELKVKDEWRKRVKRGERGEKVNGMKWRKGGVGKKKLKILRKKFAQ